MELLGYSEIRYSRVKCSSVLSVGDTICSLRLISHRYHIFFLLDYGFF